MAINISCENGTILVMGNLLRKCRIAAGLTQEQLADLAGTTHPTIGRLETGKRDLDEKWRRKLAPLLDVHPANLLFDNKDLAVAKSTGDNEALPTDLPFDNLPIVGSVEAGTYREAEEEHQDEWNYVSVPVDGRYPGIQRYCLEVNGNSMNMEFAPKSLVICADMIQLNEDPIDGAIYVVDHTHVHGEVESTLKELRIMPDGRKYLWPRSNDPEHQQPIEMNGNDGESIRLRAKVIGAYSVR
ncbi:MAG: XRE family transcriptional regulator [Sneathiella sp.]